MRVIITPGLILRLTEGQHGSVWVQVVDGEQPQGQKVRLSLQLSGAELASRVLGPDYSRYNTVPQRGGKR